MDCNLKKDYHFFIIFGTNISDATSHQVQVFTSSSALPRENETRDMHSVL